LRVLDVDNARNDFFEFDLCELGSERGRRDAVAGPAVGDKNEDEAVARLILPHPIARSLLPQASDRTDSAAICNHHVDSPNRRLATGRRHRVNRDLSRVTERPTHLIGFDHP
jgi:hypothetical protein